MTRHLRIWAGPASKTKGATGPTTLRVTVLVALSVALCGCASPGGGGSGLGAPVLSGAYELRGALTRDGADDGFPHTVTFLGNDMYTIVKHLQIGRPDPPRRAQASGDYVRIAFDGLEVRIRRGPAGGLAAEVRGTYVTSERRVDYCVRYAVDDSGRRYCAEYGERIIQTHGTYQRQISFRRIDRLPA